MAPASLLIAMAPSCRWPGRVGLEDTARRFCDGSQPEGWTGCSSGQHSGESGRRRHRGRQLVTKATRTGHRNRCGSCRDAGRRSLTAIPRTAPSRLTEPLLSVDDRCGPMLRAHRGHGRRERSWLGPGGDGQQLDRRVSRSGGDDLPRWRAAEGSAAAGTPEFYAASASVLHMPHVWEFLAVVSTLSRCTPERSPTS
jgi:hypothetical protein